LYLLTACLLMKIGLLKCGKVLERLAKIPALKSSSPMNPLPIGVLSATMPKPIKLSVSSANREIQGLIIGAMTFGDEVAALAVAQAFRDKPYFSSALKKPKLPRRPPQFGLLLRHPFHLIRSAPPGNSLRIRRHRLSEEKKFQQSVLDFMGTCSVVNGFIGANIGLVGPARTF